MALLASGMMFSSCSDDDTGADYINEFYTVKRADWKWNDAYERYEVFFDNRNVDDYMYEHGVSNGYVWIFEDGVETRKDLEYTYTIWDDVTWYDVVISYDISPGSIGFFVRSISGDGSTGAFDLTLIPNELDFKVVLMWRR